MLKSRLFLTSLLFLILSLLFVGLISHYIFTNTVTQRIFETNSSYVKSIRQSIDTLVNEMLNDYYYLLIDQRIKDLMLDILKMHPVSLSRISRDELEKEIRDNLIMFENDMIGISFISEKYRLLFGDDLIFSFSEIRDSGIYPEIAKNPNRFALIKYSFKDDPIFESMVSNGIYFAGLAQAEGKQWVVLLKTRPAFVLSNDLAIDLVIIDEDGMIIWKNTNSISRDIVKKVVRSSKQQDIGSIKLSQLTPSRSVYYHASRGKGWIYICVFDDSPIGAYRQKIIRFMLAVALLLLAVFVVFSLVISQRLVSPITKLIENIKNVSYFNDHSKIQYSDTLFRKLIGTISFRGKLILFYSLIIVLPACLFITSSYFYSHNFIMKQVEKSLFQIMKQTAKNIEVPLNNIERNSAFLAVNKSFQKVLSAKMNADSVHELNRIVMSQKLITGGISSIDVYDMDKNFIYSTRPEYFYSELDHHIDSSILNEIIGKKWNMTRKDMFDRFYIPFIRLIRSTEITSKIGYIVSNIQERYIHEKAKTFEFGSRSQSIVVDNEGRIVSAEDVEMISNLISDIIPEIKNLDVNQTVTYKGAINHYYSLPIHNSLWKLIFLIPNTEIMSDSVKILISNGISLLLLLFLMLITISIISDKVVKPLTMIRNSINGMKLADLSVDWTMNSNDELGDLADAFRKMLKRLNTLLHEVYIHRLIEKELENRKKEAQLVALQYQINPHFLYNTFSSIKFLMKLGESAKAIKMITMMGKLFKKAVHNEQIIDMKDEIDYVKAYISIQQIRYRDKLRVKWNLHKNIYKYRTLKFLLQPIVENSIHHGIVDGGNPLEIKINGRKNHENLCFEIIDNGPGIKPNEIATIQEQIDGDASTSSIGLKNISDRIQLYFGYEYGIRIESNYGKETRVSVTIPAILQQ